ncbi:MAG: PQQ-dependent dehydrogenase, methanol/ethanol family [Enterovirga sp.]|nr:PQQ-dependent dehydrogenase, methanol/ethanol family [Enterovirga sp.]
MTERPELTGRHSIDAGRPARRLAAVALWAALFLAVGGAGRAEDAPGRAPAAAITPETVRGLRLVSTFRTGNPQAHVASPQVAGDRLLVFTPFPHTLFALKVEAGHLRVDWTFRPDGNRMVEGVACCGLGLPGPAVAGDRLLLNTLDGHTIALDAATGRPLWDVPSAAVPRGETLASAPLVAGDRVIVGTAGDDFGIRGRVAALEAGSGRPLWTRFSTGSDQDVGIGPGFAPFYDRDLGRDAGVTSWPPGGWERGGGSVSGTLLHDPELGLVFHGTGRPAPINPDQRPGGNRWSSGLFARDAATGAARWFYQLASHDLHGVSGTGPLLMTDRDWKGVRRKLLIHVGLSGYVYVLDRVTGEVLSAEPFVPVNASRGVDLATGALLRSDNKTTRIGTMTRDVCPSLTGPVTPGGAALSPETGLLYIATSRLCMDIEPRPATYMQGTPFTGANLRAKRPPNGSLGALVAWDLAAGKPAWTIQEDLPVLGGPLPLPGGVVFYGTYDGYLKAVGARDGRVLWQEKLASGIVAAPTFFTAPDGAQYVSVLAGQGGALGPSAGLEVDARDATAARGLGNVLRGVPPPEDGGGALYLFALP